MRATRAGQVPPFMVMDVIARAAARERAGGTRVLPLAAGQPWLGAPAGARAAVIAALGRADPLGYTETAGLPSLRARIAQHYRQWYQTDLAADRIVVTAGASSGLTLAFLASFEPGDTVALAAPCYPPYVNILTALGMRPVLVPTDATTRYQLTVAALDRLDPCPAGVVVASPSNPAGTMLSPDALGQIAAWCAARGARLISDEIYHGVTYGGVAATLADHAVVVNSFSKYFGMAGWRVGWLVLPEDLVRPVERLAQNLNICAPHVSQLAAEAAFSCHEELQARVEAYRAGRDLLLAAIPPAWRVVVPDGAFYLYVDLGAETDGVGFCHWLLAERGVACAPGIDFDAAQGVHHVRFGYAGNPADIAAAAALLSLPAPGAGLASPGEIL